MLTYRSAALGALGDPTRRLIFETLATGPRSVGELANDLPVSRPAVSQHLKALKQAGLVTDRPAGTRRVYQVDPAGVAALRDYLDQVWSRALDAYAAAVNASADASTPTASRTVASTTATSAATDREEGDQLRDDQAHS